MRRVNFSHGAAQQWMYPEISLSISGWASGHFSSTKNDNGWF
jgi:hypothetical protein